MAETPQFSLTPEDIAEFNQRTNAAQNLRDTSIAQSNLFQNRAATDYGRTFGGRDLGDGTFSKSVMLGGGLFGKMGDQFKDKRDRLVQPLANRGVFNSGILTDAVNRHFKSKNTAFDDMEIQFQRTSQDFTSSRAGIQDALSQALANITEDKQARRGVYASMIGNN